MSAVITSLQNPRIKRAIKLRGRRNRLKQGRILIDGLRELSRAIEGRVELLELFVSPDQYANDDAWKRCQSEARLAGAEVLEVTPRVMDKLTFGQRNEGVLGVARTPQRTLHSLRLPSDPLIVVLEGIEKPGNIGAIVRSADGAGADVVVVCDAITDLYNPNAIRASLGTVFSLPLVAATARDTVSWLHDNSVRVFASQVDAPTLYTDITEYGGATAIVLGNEARGLSEAWNGSGATPIRLPMRGTADSLNVSAAAAVLLYEAQHRRTLERLTPSSDPPP